MSRLGPDHEKPFTSCKEFGHCAGYFPFATPHPYSAPLYAVLWPKMLSHVYYIYRAPVTFGFQFLAFQLNWVNRSLEKWEGGRRVKSGYFFPWLPLCKVWHRRWLLLSRKTALLFWVLIPISSTHPFGPWSGSILY